MTPAQTLQRLAELKAKSTQHLHNMLVGLEEADGRYEAHNVAHGRNRKGLEHWDLTDEQVIWNIMGLEAK